MSRSVKKLQWALIVFAMFLGAAWELFPLSDASNRLDRFPLWGDGFFGQEIPIQEIEKQVFAGNRMMKRFYQMDNMAFYVSIVDGTHNRSAVHDPTLCFQGSGWKITSRKPLLVPGGEAEIVGMDRSNGRQLEILICFSNGEDRYKSVVHYWFDTTMRRLTLGKWGDEPVRIIVEPIENQPIDWNKLAKNFQPLWKV